MLLENKLEKLMKLHGRRLDTIITSLLYNSDNETNICNGFDGNGIRVALLPKNDNQPRDPRHDN